MTIYLNPAVSEDARQVFEWRNDPFVLERSTSKRLVDWDEHRAWFASTLADPGKQIYLILNEQEKIGTVRFERVGEDDCVISAYILRQFTGKGWGVIAIKKACEMICRTWSVKNIIAYVRDDNAAGVPGFLKAGFELVNRLHACPEGHSSLVYSTASVKLSDWKEDDRRNVDYYTAQTRTYGIDSRSLNWGSAESQNLRFRILSEVVPMAGRSVLDVGCGLGDFCNWLKSKAIPVAYSGIDIVPEMIAIAKSRFPDDDFAIVNLLTNAEKSLKKNVVVASGIFAKRTLDPEGFLKFMVNVMFEMAETAVAFNSLSAWADEKEEGEFYADPLAVLTFCKTLTPWVVLRHDYHSRDFTIYMYKDRNA